MKRFLFALMGIIISLPSWAEDNGCQFADAWSNVVAQHIVILFDTGQADVKECAEQRLKAFIGGISNIKEIYLIGSASKIGSELNNTQLSMRRAQAVKALLGGQNVIIWNEGEAMAHYRNKGDDTKFDRSVTVIPVTDDGVSELYKLQTQLLTATQDMWGNVSVWKNAEGKFNTARLASDSIAGVVLGTVGGVVTSTVVKKNQVKNGFEDIKCVIGGQMVASWGDQINVGLQ